MALLEFRCRHRFASGFELDLGFESDHPFTALFGPSGSGKTTTLHIMAGLLRPREGLVRVAGRTLLETAGGLCLPPERRHIGLVFQDALLFPHMTVEGNLRYALRRRSPQRMEFARVVEVLEIAPLLGRRPHALSGGEKQRVALGRALLSRPDVLLMDEPLASLDDPLKGRVLNYLERVVAEWKVPVLYVTHSQAEVRRAAGWVLVIKDGRLVASGPVEEALAQPDPLAWTNSAGPVNLLRVDRVIANQDCRVAHLGDQSIVLPPGELPRQLPAFIHFRPADVMLSREEVRGISARNHLRGRVCRILTLPHAVFVAVDIGQVFWAEITRQAQGDLQLAVGGEVTCLLKAYNVGLE